MSSFVKVENYIHWFLKMLNQTHNSEKSDLIKMNYLFVCPYQFANMLWIYVCIYGLFKFLISLLILCCSSVFRRAVLIFPIDFGVYISHFRLILLKQKLLLKIYKSSIVISNKLHYLIIKCLFLSLVIFCDGVTLLDCKYYRFSYLLKPSIYVYD